MSLQSFSFTQIKLDYFDKQGWGYADSYFVFDPKRKMCAFGGTGTKYLYSGEEMPGLYQWGLDNLKFDFDLPQETQADMEVDEPKNVNHEFLNDVIKQKCFTRLSFDKWERVMHSHGASLREVFNLKFGRFARYVDVVVYPKTTEQVETIIALANTHKAVLIPYGGGTNVTQALYLRDQDKGQ
jgi:alkyldihydroxyacetonephosphate synthase